MHCCVRHRALHRLVGLYHNLAFRLSELWLVLMSVPKNLVFDTPAPPRFPLSKTPFKTQSVVEGFWETRDSGHSSTMQHR